MAVYYEDSLEYEALILDELAGGRFNLVSNV